MSRLALGAVLPSLAIWSLVLVWLSRGDSPGRAVLRLTVDLRKLQEQAEVGEVIDAWRGVPVRNNGIPYDRSVGSHHSPSGYYYGRQWQCVEFVKRFYFDARGHAMPDVMGHAREFYDPAVPSGEINAKRGMRQFANGGSEPPRLDDLMVWTEGSYGHVAVVCKVGADFVEVVQQNVRQGSRQRFRLVRSGETTPTVRVEGPRDPAGWLRVTGPEK
ncbi:MAG: CHAP domain-containing protein [Candidatus Methylacidiphilales bacterium]|nr:CHAP domain-containing protein [Candidatus Methylacidiphilales bacterium]